MCSLLNNEQARSITCKWLLVWYHVCHFITQVGNLLTADSPPPARWCSGPRGALSHIHPVPRTISTRSHKCVRGLVVSHWCIYLHLCSQQPNCNVCSDSLVLLRFMLNRIVWCSFVQCTTQLFCCYSDDTVLLPHCIFDSYRSLMWFLVFLYRFHHWGGKLHGLRHIHLVLFLQAFDGMGLEGVSTRISFTI